MSITFPSNVAWALSRNQQAHLTSDLQQKHPEQTYWNYVDQLVSSLRASGCGGIQNKMADVSDSRKFESTCSELEIARVLCHKGKQVKLLPDSFMGSSKSSPDLLVTDNDGQQSYVEVTRFNEDELATLIVDGLNDFLRSQATSYVVDVSIPDSLSIPVTGYRSMQERIDRANRVMDSFRQQFRISSPPPPQITAEDIAFSISPSNHPTGHVGLVNYVLVIVPDFMYVSRLRFLVALKAKKRQSWTETDLSKWYFIAVDTEQTYLEEDHLTQAVLGYTVTEHISPVAKVQVASQLGWSQFLRDKHLIADDRTYVASLGIFLSDPICDNVSGLIVKKNQDVWFEPNPFAAQAINDPRLVSYI